MPESKILGKIQLNNLPLLDSTLEESLFDEIISLMFQKDETELTSKQQNVLQTFIYDSEVLNGGHLQYFQNQGTEKVNKILPFLEEIGAHCQKEILSKVYDLAQNLPVIGADTLEEYQERAMKGEFFELDMAYYKCPAEIGTNLLQRYVIENLSEFVETE